jgi:predicted RNase H-like HicB family nuclease
MTFTAAVTHEGDWYVARCLEVEVTSQGESAEGALENLKEALELFFDEEVPPVVEHPVIATIELSV